MTARVDITNVPTLSRPDDVERAVTEAQQLRTRVREAADASGARHARRERVAVRANSIELNGQA